MNKTTSKLAIMGAIASLAVLYPNDSTKFTNIYFASKEPKEEQTDLQKRIEEIVTNGVGFFESKEKAKEIYSLFTEKGYLHEIVEDLKNTKTENEFSFYLAKKAIAQEIKTNGIISPESLLAYKEIEQKVLKEEKEREHSNRLAKIFYNQNVYLIEKEYRIKMLTRERLI